jgi:hypothetical protein
MYLFPLLELAGKNPVWSVCIVSSALNIRTYTSFSFFFDGGGDLFSSFIVFSFTLVDLTFLSLFFHVLFVSPLILGSVG